MDLKVYGVFIKPRVTEKAYRLNQKLKQLVIEVHPKANKPLIAEALKKVFNVEAEKISVINMKGKNRRAGKRLIHGKLRKKAIVTLKQGYDIDLMGVQGSPEVPEQPAPARSES